MKDKKEVLIITSNYNYNNLQHNSYMIKGILKMNNDDSDLVTVGTTNPMKFATNDFNYKIIISQEDCEMIDRVDKLFIDYTVSIDNVCKIIYPLISNNAIINIKKSENTQYFNPNTMKIIDKDVIEFFRKKELEFDSKIDTLEYKLELITDIINQSME